MKWEDVPEEEKRVFARWLGEDGIKQSIKRFRELAEDGITETPCAACEKAGSGLDKFALYACDTCLYPTLDGEMLDCRCVHFERGKYGTISDTDGVDLRHDSGQCMGGNEGRQWCAQVANDYEELLSYLGEPPSGAGIAKRLKSLQVVVQWITSLTIRMGSIIKCGVTHVTSFVKWRA